MSNKREDIRSRDTSWFHRDHKPKQIVLNSKKEKKEHTFEWSAVPYGRSLYRTGQLV
jgi:hypothetical protein